MAQMAMDNSFVEIIQNQLVSLVQKKQQKFQWFQFRQDAPSYVKINVAEDGKMFTREDKEDKGLLWYKNLNFPPINISIKSTRPIQNTESLKCQITAVKLRSNEKPEQSSLIGDLEQQFNQNTACFQKLKFTQTSHKCGMCLFSLVITIFNDSEDASQGEAGLWSIFYSSPFEIEARQRTLPERVAVQKTTYWSLFNPFLPVFLDKQYEAKNRDGQNQTIGCDIDGMFMYLRSPIIRHKVFHPIFLLLKFRDSVRLFYNKNLIKIQEGENLFSKLQRQIFEMLWQHDKPVFLDENKLFLLTLKRKDNESPLTQNEKQIIKYLKSLNGPIVTFMAPQSESFPKNFTEIKYSDGLIQKYREGFLSMALIDFKRSKMSEADKNLMLEFQATSYQSSDLQSENSAQKTNQQSFAQTIISINNKHIYNRKERTEFQCITHKNSSSSQPQNFQNIYQNEQKINEINGKRTFAEFEQETKRDDLNISEVRDQLKKLIRKSDDQPKQISQPDFSSQNLQKQKESEDQNKASQDNLQLTQLIDGNKNFQYNETNNKFNKQYEQQSQQFQKQSSSQSIQNAVTQKVRFQGDLPGFSEGDMNKSSSPVVQSINQEQMLQTQTTMPQSGSSQNTQQNVQIFQDTSISDRNPSMIYMQPNTQNVGQVVSQQQQCPPMVIQMGVMPPQMQPMYVPQQKQPNQYFQMPMYIYPQTSAQMQPFFYMQGQNQIQQSSVNNYYQDLIQKQQQIILEQQKKLEEKQKQIS
ncbi:hypothetical protein TTHERM_00670730 (macronuclear) [Tetrahymena thermophila SB210]|uniref:Uncharacterized protein n=1 Tax=Tetrahymena thermophila (strain SB210) TaxID=312017 RepID=I7MAU2_TETTS|nr:hypothetical protein TTHERM_00670730 [Tetrahymena thermophila SB210]EAS06149.2 hypothetical protein TTHERM_00670730 [Tetrahymena thermophila SB210]|eukprot:XP_001026394.2 hypothetical protein TTHERM_00670730 [Tetrahymena thermophila SB210]